jgi:hypothetical protein
LRFKQSVRHRGNKERKGNIEEGEREIVCWISAFSAVGGTIKRGKNDGNPKKNTWKKG